jgi:hypothetical protein
VALLLSALVISAYWSRPGALLLRWASTASVAWAPGLLATLLPRPQILRGGAAAVLRSSAADQVLFSVGDLEGPASERGDQYVGRGVAGADLVVRIEAVPRGAAEPRSLVPGLFRQDPRILCLGGVARCSVGGNVRAAMSSHTWWSLVVGDMPLWTMAGHE